MPLYPFRAQLCFRQSSSESQTSAPRGREFRRRAFAGVAIETGVILGTSSRPLARPGEHLGQVEITQLDAMSARFNASLRTDRSKVYWVGSDGGAAMTNDYFYRRVTPGIVPGNPLVIDNNAYLPNGDPTATVRVDGNAALSLGAGAWDVQIDVEPLGLLDGQLVQSSVQFDAWIDTSIGPGWPEVWPTLQRDRMALAAAGDGRINVGLSSAPLFVQGACGAFTLGDIYILPGDVGFGPNQIPADPAMLTVQRMRAHPGVFVRRSDAQVELDAVGEITAVPPPSVEEIPPRFMLINAAPQFSWWDVLIDGAWRRVLLSHTLDGRFVDARRPRDIYNRIVNYYLSQRRVAVWDYVEEETAPGVFGRTYYQRGELDTLSYSQAWRFRGVSVPMTSDGELPPPVITPLPLEPRPPGPG